MLNKENQCKVEWYKFVNLALGKISYEDWWKSKAILGYIMSLNSLWAAELGAVTFLNSAGITAAIWVKNLSYGKSASFCKMHLTSA